MIWVQNTSFPLDAKKYRFVHMCGKIRNADNYPYASIVYTSMQCFAKDMQEQCRKKTKKFVNIVKKTRKNCPYIYKRFPTEMAGNRKRANERGGMEIKENQKRFRKPPTIFHHYTQSEQRKCDLDAVSEKLGLSPNDYKLLQVYSSCRTGFKPALKWVEARTGIHANKVSEIRKRLMKYGIISYSNERHAITVDWQRLALYASLPAEAFAGRKKKRKYKMIAKEPAQETIAQLGMKYRYRVALPEETLMRKLTYKKIESLTTEEWNRLMTGIGVQIPEAWEVDDTSVIYIMYPDFFQEGRSYGT